MANLSKALKRLSKTCKASKSKAFKSKDTKTSKPSEEVKDEKRAIDPVNNAAPASETKAKLPTANSETKTESESPAPAESSAATETAPSNPEAETSETENKNRRKSRLDKIPKPIRKLCGAVAFTLAGLILGPVAVAVALVGSALSLIWEIVGPTVCCPVLVLCAYLDDDSDERTA